MKKDFSDKNMDEPHRNLLQEAWYILVYDRMRLGEEGASLYSEIDENL